MRLNKLLKNYEEKEIALAIYLYDIWWTLDDEFFTPDDIDLFSQEEYDNVEECLNKASNLINKRRYYVRTYDEVEEWKKPFQDFDEMEWKRESFYICKVK